MSRFEAFGGSGHRLDCDGLIVAGGSSSLLAASLLTPPSAPLLVASSPSRRRRVPIDVEMEHELKEAELEEEKQRLDAMIVVSSAWQQQLPDHKYTAVLHAALEDFQMHAVALRSRLDWSAWSSESFSMVINEFGELRSAVKAFVGDDEMEIDEPNEVPKKKRIKSKAPDNAGAYDDPDAIDID